MNITEMEGGDPDLSKAVKDLEEGKAHLDQAHEEETEAEHEIADAIEEIEEFERGHVEVHVVHVNDVQKTHFKESTKKTLQQVWDKSYEKLGIEKKPKDIFQTDGKKPKSLMSYLGLTLKEAHDQKVILDYRFGIVSESGGA